MSNTKAVRQNLKASKTLPSHILPLLGGVAEGSNRGQKRLSKKDRLRIDESTSNKYDEYNDIPEEELKALPLKGSYDKVRQTVLFIKQLNKQQKENEKSSDSVTEDGTEGSVSSTEQ
jgi:hypothetical protein